VLGIDCSCTCHSFPVGWLLYSFKYSNKCWDLHFFVPDDTMKCLNHVTPRCSLSCSTFWKHNGLILPPIVGLFGGSFTWIGVYFTSSKRSFTCCTNMSPLMCKSKGKHLVISFSYHISILSIIFITLCTHLSLSHLIVAHLSRCRCDHTIDNLSIHLLQCPCENECIATHYTLWDTITTIVLENGTHI